MAGLFSYDQLLKVVMLESGLVHASRFFGKSRYFGSSFENAIPAKCVAQTLQ